MFIRRSVAAAALLVVTLTACGTEPSGGQVAAGAGSARPSESPRPSFSPRPKCARPAEAPTVPPSPSAPSSSSGSADGPREQNGDGAPHYAENHAYRMQGSLTPESRAWGAASAGLIRAELEKVREEGGAGAYGVFDERRIAAALSRLGCGEEHGVYIGNGFYSVHTGDACVSGRVTEDQLTVKVHGAYAEPQPGTGPCVENRGGH
ncbi:hypothetical protein GCM10010297_31920 [Streptomyces malachitofuscus]|nr:hypothetical protein GCM10010297_31920 [Streptomyces malachitofuscus]